MMHSNVATTMNVCGNATIRAKQQANSKVFEMVMVTKTQQQPEMAQDRMAVCS